MDFEFLLRRVLENIRPARRGRVSRVRGPAARRPLGLERLEVREVPALLGNAVFPADNPWNEKITNAPVAANSATLVASIGAMRVLHPDFGGAPYDGGNVGIPYNVVSGTQPKVSVVIDAYSSESDLAAVPIPMNAVIEGDPLASSLNTGDRHLIVYDKDNNVAYELYNVHRPSETADGRWHADSEAVWDLSKDSFRTPGFTSADAAGLPILPGLVRPDEVLDQGVITHALRFTVPRSDAAYAYPASHEAGVANASLPRMGERFRLKRSFDISGYSKADQVILQALKDYGMIVADNGSPWFLSGEPSSRWNDADLHKLTSVMGSDFEAVDLTPRVSGLSSSTGSACSQVTVAGLDFSGGAGRTKVYFGGTAASSVVVLSDTQILATAPAGASGTVDVTVRSPYGTSAVVTADRFTFGQQATATHFQISTAASEVAGSPFGVSVTALDAANQPVAGYVGKVHFTSTDTLAVLPPDYTFTAADAGTRTFAGLTLYAAGQRTVAVAATSDSSVKDGAQVTVSPAQASRLSLTSPSGVVSGTAFNTTLTAVDPYGNFATGFRGTVQFTSSDVKGILPADYTFTVADAGTRTFSMKLVTPGVQAVTAAAGTITSQASVTVSKPSNKVTQFRVVASASTTVAGTPVRVSVTALDSHGNQVSDYVGTVKFNSTDWKATLPPNYTFTPSDGGTHTFSVVFRMAGAQPITVADWVVAQAYARVSVTVAPASFAKFTIVLPAGVIAGTPFTMTVKAEDAFGNVVPTYQGTVHFTSSDAMASLPADCRFSGGDLGIRSFTITLRQKGWRALNVADLLDGTLFGSNGVNVS